MGATSDVIRSRTVKRRPDELQWEKGPCQSVVYPPWSPLDLKDVCEEAQWTATARCQACEGDQAPVKRVGRPRQHIPACLQRQSDFKKDAVDWAV